jgi:hypothetical protein
MKSKPRAAFQSGGPMIAMVALNAPSLPAMDAVSRSLVQSWPEGPEMASISVQGDAATFELGGELACAGLMPAPIPWGDLEGPCQSERILVRHEPSRYDRSRRVYRLNFPG